MSGKSFSWDSQKYIDEVENGTDSGLQEYQKAEIDYLTTRVKLPKEKTFIDVGAGYGRVLPRLAGIAKKVIAVEIDANLGKVLQERAQQYPNCTAILGDGNNLTQLLKGEKLSKPVLISLQNTLGPWKGDRYVAIDEMRKVAETKNGEVIISLFCREAIEDWGIPMYQSTPGLIGEYEPSKSDLKNGIFKTSTGYESYWFSKEERDAIKKRLGGKVAGEVLNHKYHIFHISYEE